MDVLTNESGSFAHRSTRLVNDDLEPTTPETRTWKTFSIYAMQSCCVHSLGTYTFASSLFYFGLVGWQVFAAIMVGITIVWLLMNKTGIAGQNTGLTYPVFCRISFGVFGANFAAVVRAIPSIAWYGIQTWLASVAVVLLLVASWPDLAPLTKTDFLGLSTLGWISFVGLWFFQLIVIRRGMETIKRFQDFAGPAIWVVMALMAIYLWIKAGGKLDLNLTDHRVHGAAAWHMFFVGVFMVVTYSAGILLNFMDFSRLTSKRRHVVHGNFWGLPVNYLGLALTIVISTSASITVFGRAITDPVEIVAEIDNQWITILGSATFIVATIGINVVSNFISAAYDISNLWPERISFRTGGIIAAVIAVAILPWHLYNSPLAIKYFLGALGAMLGPMYGIIFSDYFMLRRKRIDLAALYTENPKGPYFYCKGWNPIAMYSMIAGSVITLPIALIPYFEPIASFSWPIGVVAGATAYILFNRGRNLEDTSLPAPVEADFQ